jgi:2-isopropylmalate synthase
VIINLPATVEMSTPNIHADQIEWMSNNFSNRKRIILSLHPHNDRGTAVAATELGLMAGADRVEGTLFGNGERTGNVDLITLGLNMFTQGVDPHLDFSKINELIETTEFCNRLPIHERHPYAGSLVHTAFSGSHQDAIGKGMEAIKSSNNNSWSVPYLPIDPADLGRTYEAIIRVNSQSGKGGTAWLLENDHQIRLPKGAEIDLSYQVQKLADKSGVEITSDIIWKIYSENFILKSPFSLIEFNVEGANRASNLETINAKIMYNNNVVNFSSQGNGPISAFVNGMRENFDLKFTLEDFGQNTRSATSKAEAAAYVELKVEDGKRSIFGCGISTSITVAPILAVISAINKIRIV